MALSLQKGQKISLAKEAPGLTKALVGLGWDTRITDGEAFDLDASAILTGADNKVRSDADFIFYNQPETPNGSVKHMGDNRDGSGDGDDEQILIDLSTVDPDVQTIRIVVTIHNEGINFGSVDNAFIRLVNNDTDVEVARYDLSEDKSTENAIIFGQLYRAGDDWKFSGVDEGFNDGLGGIARAFGVNV